MYDPSAPGLNTPLVGENGPDVMAEPGAVIELRFVSRLVMASPLGSLLCAEEDFRFLLGPDCPNPVGDAGRDRFRGVMVPGVVCCEAKFGIWCMLLDAWNP